MTTIDRFERELPEALLDVAGTHAPDYLVDILGRTAATRQRPAWASLERWLPMELASSRAPSVRTPWRAVAVLALVALLVIAGLVVLAGSQRPAVPAPFGPAGNGLIPYEADGDIFVGDPITGQTRLLVGGPDIDYGPTFSPDGTLVAFLRASADCPAPGDVCPGGEEVVVVRADGRDARSITGGPIVELATIAWAPDSRGLVARFGAGGDQQLALIPVDGGAPHRLSDGFDADWIVFRPPAGEELLIRGKVNGVWGLYAMRPDGSDLRLLAPSAFSAGTDKDPDQDLNFPAYAHDGSRIFYNRYTPAAGTIQAWVMDADGSNQRRFNGEGPACCWWEGEMAPSPDGTSVVMWRSPPTGTGAITLFPADGSGTGTVIGPSVAGTGIWWWAPDSTRVLLNFNDAAEGDQGLIDPVTGEFTTLPWNADAQPDWQRTAK